MEEFEHVRSMGKQMGFQEMMSNQDMKDVYPFLETHDLEGGLWDSTDGDIDPAQLSQAFAKGARDLGARLSDSALLPTSHVMTQKMNGK